MDKISYFQKKGDVRFDQQYLAGGQFFNWIRLLGEHGGVSMRYWAKGFYITVVSLAGAPFRVFETLKYRRKIKRVEMRSPVFIIGHWRSGTTHLLRVMAQNPAFAVVTLVHTMIPGLFLTNPLFRYILRQSVPSKRHMDNVTLAPDEGEEEEYAMGNMGPYSFYHALSFPRNMRAIFDKYVLFEGVKQSVIRRWKKMYLVFLKKVTLSCGGKRLLLKNPANTSRIKVLLEMFPDARFIFIYRNPYVVYTSTMNWLNKEMVPTALQTESEKRLRENAMLNYQKLIQNYLEQRSLIPEGNLVEVRFEEFEQNPLGMVEQIYQELSMTLDEPTRERTREYLATVAGYQKNEYRLDPEISGEITRRWGFAIKQWGYPSQ